MRTTRRPEEWQKLHDGTFQFKLNRKVYTHNLKSNEAYFTEGKLYSNDGGKTYYRGGGSIVGFKIGERVPETQYIDIGKKQWWE